MNGSAYQPTIPTPVINVHRCDRVSISVLNGPSTEVHGFGIEYYFERTVAINPGDSINATFTANTLGDFRIFCTVPCAIHPLMQNGLLVVSI